MFVCAFLKHILHKPRVRFFISVRHGSMMEYDTENMNSEEIYSSLRGVTEAIQSFSYRSQEDLNDPIRPEGKRDDAVSHRHQTSAVLQENSFTTFPLSRRYSRIWVFAL